MGYNHREMHERPNPARLLELRYALNVLEESTHLGLDDEGTSQVRRILLKQIAKT